MQSSIFCSLVLLFFLASTTQVKCDWVFPEEEENNPLPPRPKPGDVTVPPPSQTKPQTPNEQKPELPVAPTNIPNLPGIIAFSPCTCPFTVHYNPVCGSDGKTYHNVGILNCHRTCGINVTFVKNGGCSANRS